VAKPKTKRIRPRVVTRRAVYQRRLLTRKPPSRRNLFRSQPFVEEPVFQIGSPDKVTTMMIGGKNPRVGFFSPSVNPPIRVDVFIKEHQGQRCCWAGFNACDFGHWKASSRKPARFVRIVRTRNRRNSASIGTRSSSDRNSLK